MQFDFKVYAVYAVPIPRVSKLMQFQVQFDSSHELHSSCMRFCNSLQFYSENSPNLNVLGFNFDRYFHDLMMDFSIYSSTSYNVDVVRCKFVQR